MKNKKLVLTNILSRYTFDEEISTTHCAKISRMKNDPRDDPACALYFPVGCYRETPSHAYEDKDNKQPEYLSRITGADTAASTGVIKLQHT